jgi:FkbM family methyltransferase
VANAHGRVHLHYMQGEQVGAALVAQFVDELTSHPSDRGVVVDVGANTGSWSRSTMMALQRRGAHRRTRLLLVEPQPQYHASLQSLADRWGGTLLRDAAWTEDAEQLTFYRSSNPTGASLVSAQAKMSTRVSSGAGAAAALHERARVAVRGFDLPRLLTNLTAAGSEGSASAAPPWLLLKLEYAIRAHTRPPSDTLTDPLHSWHGWSDPRSATTAACTSY